MEKIHPLDRPGVREAVISGLGITKQAVSNWKTFGVPVKHCTFIEQATNGAVKRKELRPNDWQNIWPELATQTEQTV